MTFTKDSGLVKVWVRKIMKEDANIDDVPELFNLKDIVTENVERIKTSCTSES